MDVFYVLIGIGPTVSFLDSDVLKEDIFHRFRVKSSQRRQHNKPEQFSELVNPVAGQMVWEFSDRYNWYNDPYFSHDFARKDKLPGRPLMFDENFQPKPASDAVVNALQNAPRR